VSGGSQEVGKRKRCHFASSGLAFSDFSSECTTCWDEWATLNVFHRFSAAMKLHFLSAGIESSHPQDALWRLRSNLSSPPPQTFLAGRRSFAGRGGRLQTLIEYLEGGQTIDEFLDGFPTVSREQVIAFLEDHSRRDYVRQ
jgi:uncharacterized protein (DUF433 family)